ncbi:MAG: LysR family transcriptional regulator [Rhodoplanes sp.]|nr:LysR family transcriptional regulator [Rhodoplanes sp.]
MRGRRVPLNPIRTFEVAARCLSFTAAAKELNVTQVAVSRQIRALEEYLEVSLFERSHRSIRLTENGQRLFPAINRALDDIDGAVAAVSMRGRRDVLSVHTHTTFGQRWLIPRLQRFHDRFADIEIRLTASAHPVIDARANQVVIRTGTGRFDGCDAEFLAPVELIPVCTKALTKSWKVKSSPANLARHTLLHSLARPNDWAQWLASVGMTTIDATRGLKFENSVLAYEAALQGIGVAMGVRVLVAQYLRLGSLVAPFPHVLPLDLGYYLLVSKDRRISPGIKVFRDWLRDEISAELS